jgi:hypothetical protein
MVLAGLPPPVALMVQRGLTVWVKRRAQRVRLNPLLGYGEKRSWNVGRDVEDVHWRTERCPMLVGTLRWRDVGESSASGNETDRMGTAGVNGANRRAE